MQCYVETSYVYINGCFCSKGSVLESYNVFIVYFSRVSKFRCHKGEEKEVMCSTILGLTHQETCAQRNIFGSFASTLPLTFANDARDIRVVWMVQIP
jgi:hypothetical protein